MNRWFYLLLVVAATVHAGKWKTRNKNNKDTGSTKVSEESATDTIFKINKKLSEKSMTSAFSAKNEDGEVKIHEGDIVLTQRLKKYLLKKKSNPKSEDSPFDAISNGAWPNAVVPYTFARGFSYGTVVRQAIAEYNKKTCIRFKPRTSERNYVEFMHGGGCYSMIGRQGRKQQISLGRGCGQIGVTIHEMMHALGFFHEQSRLDRDRYITVNFANIRRSMWYNFEKYKRGQASTLNEPYDKSSVMHYGNYAFSTNGQKTIVSRSNPNERLGQRRGLSTIDVNQLKKYYKCPGTEVKTTTTTTTKAPTTGCTDAYKFCSILSSNGVCSNGWVKGKCKKSCDDPICKTKPANCVDKNKNCISWSKYNRHCKYSTGCCKSGSYVSYMKDNCKDSCGTC